MPASAPWLKMWLDYDHDQVDRDFAQIASLGANAVRIVVCPWGIGYPNVTTDGAKKLRDIVDLARLHGLAVQLTLFDWFDPFTHIAESLSWMKQALSPYKNNRSIALIEVKNEINLADPNVLPWAKAMMAALPSILPGVPRTISLGGAQDAKSFAALANALPPTLMDVVDVHLYGTPAVVEEKLDNALRVSDGRPVFVGEMGQATLGGTSDACDDDQVNFFEQTRLLLAVKGVTGIGVWNYSDIDPADAPAKYVGTDQVVYGLRTVAGAWKPAATIVRQMFAQTGTGASALARLMSGPDAFGNYDGGFSCSEASLPASSTVSGYDSWAIFDGKDVQQSGIAPGLGVDGSPAAYLRGTGGDTKVQVPSIVHRFKLAGVRSVTVSARLRLKNPSGWAAIGIAWYNDRGTYLGNSSAPRANNSNQDWQTLTLAGRAPTNATNFQVHLMSYDNSGVVYFDQVTVKPGS